MNTKKLSSLYEKMHYWLEAYVSKSELDGVAAMCTHIATKHSKTSFAIGLVVGLFAGVILLQWLR